MKRPGWWTQEDAVPYNLHKRYWTKDCDSIFFCPTGSEVPDWMSRCIEAQKRKGLDVTTERADEGTFYVSRRLTQ